MKFGALTVKQEKNTDTVILPENKDTNA